MTALGTVFDRGTLAARPSAGIDGQHYVATDNNTIYRDNGSSWDVIADKLTITTQTTGYTAVRNDIVICNSASAFTVTLPAVASSSGAMIVVKNKNTGLITVDGAGAETIDDQASQTLSQYDSITVVCDGSEWWII